MLVHEFGGVNKKAIASYETFSNLALTNLEAGVRSVLSGFKLNMRCILPHHVLFDLKLKNWLFSYKVVPKCEASWNNLN